MTDPLAKAVELYSRGNVAEAERLLRDYARQWPGNAAVHRLLGQIAYARGQVSHAIRELEVARVAAPRDADIGFSLAALYDESGEKARAAVLYGELLRMQPRNDSAWSNLGIIHYEWRDYSAAIGCFRHAIAINPRNERATFNLGLSLTAVGDVEEANRHLRAACDLAPGNHAMRSCLLFNLHNTPALTPDELYREHRRWGAQFDAGPLAPAPAIRAGRRIRVGYVSPDFRRHSVFYFIQPILRSHDRSVFECLCYSDVLRPDDATSRLMALADGWRDISRLPDEQVAQQIRDDGVDILVDLAGHTDRNRLPLFASRPAPVQVSWLGYPDTTGLRAIGYRLSDRYADPPGAADALHTEILIRLASGFLCYEPPGESPPPAATPARRNGYVTFGSFNNLSKASPGIIAAWAAILRGVPASRLILKAHGLGDPAGRAHVEREFARHGIETARVDCRAHVAELHDHFEMYREVDIALDTWPYNGTTTTCEALWMGVPVITWCGDRHVSRVGMSLLTTVELAECIAESSETYVALACGLGADLARLERLRAGLRERLQRSPLMAAENFTRELERRFREFLNAAASPPPVSH